MSAQEQWLNKHCEIHEIEYSGIQWLAWVDEDGEIHKLTTSDDNCLLDALYNASETLIQLDSLLQQKIHREQEDADFDNKLERREY